MVTLRAVSTGLAEGQAPLKVVWAKEGALLPQGEAWVRLDAPPGAELRLALPRARRFHRDGRLLHDPGLTKGV